MFTKSEADRILKRAAEIEGSEDTRPMSLDELRSIADEAGFGADAVERAIIEAKQRQFQKVAPEPVRRSGIVMSRFSTGRTVPVEVDSEQLMRAIRLFQPYRDGVPQIRLEEDRLTWRDARGIVFTVWSSAGATEVHVFLSKLVLRRGRWGEWVRTAADRLESLILLIGTRAALEGITPNPRLTASSGGQGG